MCEHDPTYARQAAIRLHHATPSGRTEGFCDPCIAPLVQALNDAGLQTVASCCGHGHQPPSIALEDGRWVVVVDHATYLATSRRFPDIHGQPIASREITPESAVKFLREAARYFAQRPTGGEDAAHWANVYNAETCGKIADLLESPLDQSKGE